MQIVENQKDLLEDFISLNEEWISKYFELEKSDFELARDPEKIIRSGGYIFSIRYKQSAVGVCALFSEGNGIYELARMAVSPKFQGKGLGSKLVLAAIQKAKEIGATRLYLISNTKLETAIALYKKHGFQTESLGQHPLYSRANITMSYHPER